MSRRGLATLKRHAIQRGTPKTRAGSGLSVTLSRYAHSNTLAVGTCGRLTTSLLADLLVDQSVDKIKPLLFDAVRNSGEVIVMKGCHLKFDEDWSKELWLTYFQEGRECSESSHNPSEPHCARRSLRLGHCPSHVQTLSTPKLVWSRRRRSPTSSDRSAQAFRTTPSKKTVLNVALVPPQPVWTLRRPPGHPQAQGEYGGACII